MTGQATVIWLLYNCVWIANRRPWISVRFRRWICRGRINKSNWNAFSVSLYLNFTLLLLLLDHRYSYRRINPRPSIHYSTLTHVWYTLTAVTYTASLDQGTPYTALASIYWQRRFPHYSYAYALSFAMLFNSVMYSILVGIVKSTFTCKSSKLLL